MGSENGFYLLCLLSTTLGSLGAWIIAHTAYQLGLIDHPNQRSSHHRSTPKGGGIGILAAFVLTSLFIQIHSTFWIPTTLLALLSFFGDKLDLSPRLRLPLQFIAAIALLTGTRQFQLGQINGLVLIIPLAFFAVGTANLYNFMDGINGISAITGIVGFGLLALSDFLSGGDKSFVMLSICISLSCLGFLPFNVPKAKVFMGDVGSILLGFVFAGMVVALSKGFLDFVCLTSFLFAFYADELSTMAVRLRDGENLLRPHRRHLYQLLANEKGVSHWKISVGYGLFQLVVGVTVLLLKPLGILVILSLLAAYFSAFVVVSSAIRKNLAPSSPSPQGS